jgi:dCTP deaminase
LAGRARSFVCILSDRDIRERLERKELGIEPYVETNLTPNGYDLTAKEVLVRPAQTPQREGTVTLAPGASFLVSTREFLRMPPDVSAQLWIRSSYARRGLFLAFGKVEAGFQGELTVGGFNGSPEPVALPVGDRFCQIAFERLHSPPERLYHERSGTYQGQRGVTLAR